MLNQYIEPLNNIKLLAKEKKEIEALVGMKASLEKCAQKFYKLYKDLQNSGLLSEKELFTLEQDFSREFNQQTSQFNEARLNLFHRLQHFLPKELSTSFELNSSKVMSAIDALGILGSGHGIGIEKLHRYIEENDLVVFPLEFLKQDYLNDQIRQVIGEARKFNPQHKPYIVGTINNIDLNKLLNGRELDVTQCILCNASQPLLSSLMFQLPLLQSLNEEIKSLKQNSSKMTSQLNVLNKNMETLVDQQFKINQTFNQKISEIVHNLYLLNKESYNYREEQRRKNPTYYVKDESVILTRSIEAPVYARPWSAAPCGYKLVGVVYYNPLKAVFKEKSEQYDVAHIAGQNNLQVMKKQELTLDEAKQIIRDDLKSNFTCILAKNLQDMQEKAKVICSFGKGFHPLTSIAFTPDEMPALPQAKRTAKKVVK